MPKLKLLNILAVLSGLAVTPAQAQAIISEPSACALYHPNGANSLTPMPSGRSFARMRRNGNGAKATAGCFRSHPSFDAAPGTFIANDGMLLG
jgi:hypothetical protein